MHKNSKGSGKRRGRLPKGVYLKKLGKEREQYNELTDPPYLPGCGYTKIPGGACHKKKDGPPSYYSGPSLFRNGKISCACCDITLAFQNEMKDNIISTKMDCELNCCYDCGFKCYCHKCCFTVTRVGREPYRTCGITMMKQLLNSSHGGGRYSSLDNDTLSILREKFKKDMKYGIHRDTLRGKSYMEEVKTKEVNRQDYLQIALLKNPFITQDNF